MSLNKKIIKIITKCLNTQEGDDGRRRARTPAAAHRRGALALAPDHAQLPVSRVRAARHRLRPRQPRPSEHPAAAAKCFCQILYAYLFLINKINFKKIKNKKKLNFSKKI